MAPDGAGPSTPVPQIMPNGTMPNSPAPAPPVPMANKGQMPIAANTSTSNGASPQELQAVMAEVETLGRIDPRAQAELLEELKQVDPSLWPMTVQSVKSRVAYAQRYGNGSKRQRLADRRSAIGSSTIRREINLQGDYPSAYPTTSPTRGVYPTTDAATELSPRRIDSPPNPRSKYPSTQYPGTDYPSTGNPSTSYPSTGAGHTNVKPRRDNSRMQANSPAPDEAPPWPDTDAVLRHLRPDSHSTVKKKPPGDVIHTSYHSGPPEPGQLSTAKSGDSPDKDHDELQKGSAGVSPSQVQDDDWRPHVESAIAALESRLNSKEKDSGGKAEAADHARLRILQLLAGRRNDALSDMPIDDSAVRDFWSNELFGLDILLDTQRFSRDTHRAGEAKRHLCQAVTALGESAALEISNLAFCSKVQSYGSIQRFEKSEFLPGQRLLLYAEIDNFHSENTAKGYHTSLRNSFQIFDSSGRRVDKRESTTSEDHCQSPRRDYFIGCDFRLPTKIYPGRHTLKLTVEDLKSHKVTESSIDFTVKEK